MRFSKPVLAGILAIGATGVMLTMGDTTPGLVIGALLALGVLWFGYQALKKAIEEEQPSTGAKNRETYR